MKEVKNILDILKQTRKAIQEDNPHEIKILSDRTIHSAAIYQDPENVIIAVLIYSIGKILERDHYRRMKGYKEFHNSLLKNLDEGIQCLENKQINKCTNFMGAIRENINKIDGDLSDYIRDVFNKADINKAFKLYEHGISSAQTADLLGVSLWDLASYIGQSKVHEARVTISMPIQKRIQIAEKIGDKKFIIFDAGPIISLTMNGMLEILTKLKEETKAEFIITPQVKREIIDRPMKIKKYKLEAIQVQELLEKGILKMSREFISDNQLESNTKKILKAVNGTLRTTKNGEKIKILHEGEASCIAFSQLCNCENLIVVDERTTRLLSEAPKKLEQLMEKKLHTPLEANLELLKEITPQTYVRSTELAFVAYKRNLLPLKKNRDTLDALLYGLKFKGTAISSQEIETMKKMA